MIVLIGTYNKHKIEEYKKILSPEISEHLKLRSPHDFDLPKIEIDETGSTFEENAKIKVIEFYNHYQTPCFSDDSGISVDALNGEPGIYSARYAGAKATDQDNVIKLLDALSGIHIEDRTAKFVAVICFFDGKEVFTFRGEVAGKIDFEPKGAGGFGYDPVFIPNGFNDTFSVLSAEIKNKISHRAVVSQKFIQFLKNYLK